MVVKEQEKLRIFRTRPNIRAAAKKQKGAKVATQAMSVLLKCINNNNNNNNNNKKKKKKKKVIFTDGLYHIRGGFQ